MNLFELAQFGVAIFAVGCLAYVITFVVKKFLDFLKRQEDNFTDIIKNHISDDTEAKKQLEKSHVGLTKVIEQLLRFLERNNRK
ncbi:MAG: hypothetical protein ACKKMS_00180 [Candidatus Nealsonbacteria bacterium]